MSELPSHSYGMKHYIENPDSPGNVDRAVGQLFESACQILDRIRITAENIETITLGDNPQKDRIIELFLADIARDWSFFITYSNALPEEITEPVYQNIELMALLQQANVELHL